MSMLKYDVLCDCDDFVSYALESMRGLVTRGSEIDLRAAESDKSEASHETLLRSIAPLLDEALAVIGQVQSHFEREGDDSEWAEVADIAALAGMALQERRALLQHPQPCDHWTYLESCERSLRSLTKSAKVVAGALARFGRAPEHLNRAAELAASLGVRRRYATLRRDVTHASSRHADLRQRLRAVSKGIAALLACEEYPLMRLGDRREIRMLQFRIQSWLSSEHPAEAAGQRTWDEVTSVVSLLGGISRRSELFAHDAAVLSRLAEAVARRDELRVLRDVAEPLFGLDADLDHLLDIQLSAGAPRDRWEQTVARLAAERGITNS